MGYYIHNLHFVAFARSMQGRVTDAVRTADEIAAGVQPMVAAMPDMVDAFAAMPLFIRVRFQRWDDLLAAPAPNTAGHIHAPVALRAGSGPGRERQARGSARAVRLRGRPGQNSGDGHVGEQ